MKKTNTKKIAMAGIFCAVAVVGSLFSFPIFGSKCSPVQHMVNILCAVLLGPGYGLGAAFGAAGALSDRKHLRRPVLASSAAGCGPVRPVCLVGAEPWQQSADISGPSPAP